MVHGKKRIPYWIDWRLPGLAGPEYHAVISFGLPIEPEDSQYGEYRLKTPNMGNTGPGVGCHKGSVRPASFRLFRRC